MNKTSFYNKEDLSSEAIRELIGIWESEAGESFTDYCEFSVECDKNFLKFLEKEYPVLYEYHKKVAGDDWLDYCIQYVVQHCEQYVTDWIPEDKFYLYNDQIELVRYILAEFILKDNKAWLEFVDFFTSGSNTANGTPYIDCYDIRKTFEEWRQEKLF